MCIELQLGYESDHKIYIGWNVYIHYAIDVLKNVTITSWSSIPFRHDRNNYIRPTNYHRPVITLQFCYFPTSSSKLFSKMYLLCRIIWRTLMVHVFSQNAVNHEVNDLFGTHNFLYGLWKECSLYKHLFSMATIKSD